MDSIGFKNYILKNLETYRNIISNDKPYFDDFYKVNVKKPNKFISRKLNKEIIIEERICPFTNKSYNYNILFDSNRHKIYNISDNSNSIFSNFSDEKLKRLANIFEYTRYCFNKKRIKNIFIFFTELNNYSKSILKKILKEFNIKYSVYESYLNNKTTVIYNTMISLYGIESYTNEASLKRYNIEDMFSNKIYNICSICNTNYKKYSLFYNFNTSKILKRKIAGKFSCSKKCYGKLLANKSKFYEYNNKSKIKQSEKLKNKILSGEFTPCVTNSRCKSRVYSKTGIPFRSTWEAVFYSIMKNKGVNLKFEKLRIEYEFNNMRSVYIIDFLDEENKKVYEIKPKGNINEDKVVAKEIYATQWCLKNNHDFIFISDDWFKENVTQETIDIVLKECIINKDVLLRRMKQFLI